MARVLVFDGAAPRGAHSRDGDAATGCARLRAQLERLRCEYELVSLAELCRGPRVGVQLGAVTAGGLARRARGERCERRALAFVGGWKHHLEHAAPLLAALRIPAHFFIPLSRVGLGGHVTLRELHSAALGGEIRLEIDGSAEAALGLREQIRELMRARATLAPPAARAPAYVWFGDRPLDARLKLLLAQTGLRAAVCLRSAECRLPRGTALLRAVPVAS